MFAPHINIFAPILFKIAPGVGYIAPLCRKTFANLAEIICQKLHQIT
jgi:hypothetical protein